MCWQQQKKGKQQKKQHHSTAAFLGAPAATYNLILTGYPTGITADLGAVLETAGVSTPGTIMVPNININLGSVYRRGAAFPVANSCANSHCP